MIAGPPSLEASAGKLFDRVLGSIAAAALLTLPGASVLTQSSAPGAATAQPAGVLEGRILEGSRGVPAAFAWVELRSGTSLGVSGQRLTTRTDESGHFSISGIPPEAYSFVAVKPGFTPTFYSAAGGTTQDPGERIIIGPATPTKIEVRLVPGGVITGRVTDHFGQPQPGAQLSIRNLPLTTRPRTSPFYFPPRGKWETDASGEFRLFGLPEGDYIVAAEVGSNPISVGSTDQPRRKLAKVFYPGTSDMDQARAVTVRGGTETAGVDIQLRFVSMFTVSGSINVPAGRYPSLVLWKLPANELFDSVEYVQGGGFKKSGLTAGRYRLTGTLPGETAPGRPASPMMWGRLEFTVIDSDLSGLELVLQPGVTAAGQVQSDGPLPAEPLRVVFEVTGRSFTVAAQRQGFVGADGQFVVSEIIPETYLVSVFSGQSTRLQATATLNGQPLANNQIEVSAGANITGLEIRVRK